jgi:PHD/YefM family antitoxin component YafN of YafNO toxin-antitoxin module
MNQMGKKSKKSEINKPLWITRDGVDVAVVISPELFEELVSAQEELEDIAAVDEAMKNESPGIPWEQVKKRLARKNKAVSVDIDEI